MTSRDFCYWLQGFFEIHGSAEKTCPPSLDAYQTEIVKRHLALVFIHEIDPSQGGPEKQAVLQQVHDGKTQPAHASGCVLDANHIGNCQNKRPQIGGTGPGGTTYRC